MSKSRSKGEEPPQKNIFSEMVSQTPDSGIDLSKFNIVDYILSNEEGQDEMNEELMVWDELSVNEILLQQTSKEGEEVRSSVGEGGSGSGVLGLSEAFTEDPLQEQVGVSRSFQLRTSIRQEVDRVKCLELDKKKRDEEIQTRAAQERAGLLKVSNPVNLPSTPPPRLPTLQLQKTFKLSQVPTLLENPTVYHLQQKARSAVGEIVGGGGGKMGRYSNEIGGGGSVPPTLGVNQGQGAQGQSGQGQGVGSAPPNVYAYCGGQESGGGSVPPSPGPDLDLSVGTSVTSGCSDNYSEYINLDGDALNDRINTIRLNEEIDGGGGSSDGLGRAGNKNGSLPGAKLQLKVKMGGGRSAPPSAPGSTSPNPPPHDKERRKKDNHNQIEKKRRLKINDNIIELRKELPQTPGDPHFDVFGGDLKNSKGIILEAALAHTKLLKVENSDFKVANATLKMELDKAERDKKTLFLQIQRLRDHCGRNGIPLPEESRPWNADSLNNLFTNYEQVQIKQEPVGLEESVMLGGVDIMEEDRSSVFQGSGDIMLGHHLEEDEISGASALDSLDFPIGMEIT